MPSLGSGASGFWTLLFVWSKIIELIDTLLLLLHGKELRFLQEQTSVSVAYSYCHFKRQFSELRQICGTQLTTFTKWA